MLAAGSALIVLGNIAAWTTVGMFLDGGVFGLFAAVATMIGVGITVGIAAYLRP